MSILLQTHPDGDNAAFRVSRLVFYAQLFGKEKEQKQTNIQTITTTTTTKQAEEEGGRHEVCCLFPVSKSNLFL